MLIPLTRAMAQGPMSREREERLAEIERLTTIGLIALKRLWSLLPDPESQVPKLPPAPMKPGDLRRLAARMRAGRVPKDAVPVSVEEVEWTATYQKRAIWVWHKMRALEARLKPLWAAEEAECERIEQMVFHETKSIVAADHCSGMNDSYQTMKRAFRESAGRRNGARRKSAVGRR